jgi:ribonuclease-3
LKRLRYLFLSPSDKKLVFSIKNISGFYLKNLLLYKVAFQHKNYDLNFFSNERLEFLGDAVLSLVVADFFFKKFPNEEEGFLTNMRSRVVNREILGQVAIKMGIKDLLQNTSEDSKYCYGNGLEAFIGAIYLDLGYKKSYKFILKMIDSYLDLNYIIENDNNFKSIIFEWASKNQKNIVFCDCEKILKENQIFFRTILKIDEKEISSGEGKSKKISEQNAARLAIEILKKNSEFL